MGEGVGLDKSVLVCHTGFAARDLAAAVEAATTAIGCLGNLETIDNPIQVIRKLRQAASVIGRAEVLMKAATSAIVSAYQDFGAVHGMMVASEEPGGDEPNPETEH